VQTIQTYDEVQEGSALSRVHVWTVALAVARQHPLGIGLWNFQSVYDAYDFSDGRFGRGRAVHNSHLQTLVEAGWLGAATWLSLFGWAFFTAFRIRRRHAATPEASEFFRTMSNALLGSLCAFMVGGTFVSMAYNDIIWLIFAAVAALDKISLAELASGVPVPQTAPAPTVPTWRAGPASPSRAPARARA
jgi:O-antigen ligase